MTSFIPLEIKLFTDAIMDQALRIEKIEKLMEDQKPREYKTLPMAKKQIPVYRVPVSLLIFNQYNHRIASWIKTYSAEHDNLDVSTPEGEESSLVTF